MGKTKLQKKDFQFRAFINGPVAVNGGPFIVVNFSPKYEMKLVRTRLTGFVFTSPSTYSVGADMQLIIYESTDNGFPVLPLPSLEFVTDTNGNSMPGYIREFYKAGFPNSERKYNGVIFSPSKTYTFAIVNYQALAAGDLFSMYLTITLKPTKRAII